MIKKTNAVCSRRGFLKESGTVAAASALTGLCMPHVHAGEDNTIQLALIGCGGRGTGAVGNAMTAEKGPVTLRIYDGRGRLVRTLVDGHLAAGRHEELWDGRDDGGRGAASGVYHYVLKTGQGQLQRKMTLVR